MGEARQRQLEQLVADAKVGPGPVAVKLPIQQGIVLMQLDQACHCLAGFAHALGNNLGLAEPADEVQKAINFLQAYKNRYLASQQSKLIIAQPSDVPPPLLVK